MAKTKGLRDRKRWLGFKPNKRLGQHFITDKGVIDQIIGKARFPHSCSVLEIGPGFGALTIPLSSCVKHVVAIEKDPYLASILEEKLVTAGSGNVKVLNDDILKLDLNKISEMVDGPIHVIGNLPYNISSPLLERLIFYRNVIQKAVLMFQAEFGNRLVAVPGTKSYGAITVLMQYYTQITPLLHISKEFFHPKPKIDSVVLSFDMEKSHPRKADDEPIFKMVVKGAFAQRRKTILNSLKGALLHYSADKISASLQRCSIDAGLRAETLGIDDFICLASMLGRDE
ncbi:MAG: ribosomal RNA small subunit methyltransferase A [Deltaproteobacteria bacterium]|nr:ribosomal RNA small subunit methyltransferase A [Deltaproteobacteria bacterium]